MDVHSMSEKQLLAVVTAMVEAKPAQRALAVVLGADGLPDLGEFHSNDPDEIERWKELLELLQVAGERLHRSFDGRAVQTSTVAAS